MLLNFKNILKTIQSANPILSTQLHQLAIPLEEIQFLLFLKNYNSIYKNTVKIIKKIIYKILKLKNAANKLKIIKYCNKIINQLTKMINCKEGTLTKIITY